MENQPPKYVMLAGHVEEEPRVVAEPEISVLFRAGAYEILKARSERDAYLLLRLEQSAVRPRDCVGVIGVCYGSDVRRRMADVHVKISRTGEFRLAGLDADLIRVVGRLCEGREYQERLYLSNGNHLSLSMAIPDRTGMPQLVIPRVELKKELGLEAQLEELMQARSRRLREGRVWDAM